MSAAATGGTGVGCDCGRVIRPRGEAGRALCRSRWSTVGTRLVTETDRRLIPFADLSGERWRVALDIAIEAVGVRRPVGHPSGSVEGLDPGNQAEIAEHCRNRGAVLLTAEADGGEGIAVEGDAMSVDTPKVNVV